LSYNDDKGALADYDTAISINPQDPDTYYVRGILKAKKLKDSAGAIEDFRQAAKLYRQKGNQEWLKNSISRLEELGAKE
jgi:tetratricopeptide (TPR) repeat protein